jgi:hypothetical protein
MRNVLITAVLILLGFFAYRQFIKYPYRYVGYFYPDIENMNNWVESQPLGSLNSCHNWVNEMINKYRVYDNNYDFECGKDCYKGDPYGQGVIYTCHTSVR